MFASRTPNLCKIAFYRLLLVVLSKIGLRHDIERTNALNNIFELYFNHLSLTLGVRVSVFISLNYK